VWRRAGHPTDLLPDNVDRPLFRSLEQFGNVKSDQAKHDVGHSAGKQDNRLRSCAMITPSFLPSIQ
jgi:hypothetical protein